MSEWWDFLDGLGPDVETRIRYLRGHAPAPIPWADIIHQLTESDPLKVTRIADRLRCVRPDEDVDLEEVRSLLKAVRSGGLYETLPA